MRTPVRVVAVLAAALLAAGPRSAWAAPEARLLSPPPGAKMRQNADAPVRLRVRAGDAPLQSWVLTLVGPAGSSELASGSAALEREVAVLHGADLEPGATYRLVLEAIDVAGASARAESRFLVPDPQYTLIPLEPGNFSRAFFEGMSVDSTGDVVAYADRYQDNTNLRIFRLEVPTATLTSFGIPITNSSTQKLTRDGNRYLFLGGFRQPYCFDCLAFYDATTGEVGPMTSGSGDPVHSFVLFTADRTGTRFALQSSVSLDPEVFVPDGTLQYYFLDTDEPYSRALTADPHAIDTDTGCLSVFEAPQRGVLKRPLMTADGSTAYFLSGRTFGLVSENPNVGCHLFAYDVATRTTRVAAELPRDLRFIYASIDDGGHYLSFSAVYKGPRFYGTVPALFDLERQEMRLPLTPELGDYAGFDSVVTGDGSALVLSSKGDLDPHVGNADGNMELFLYDLASGQFTQIAETTGGVDRFPGGCPAYGAQTNADGRVVLFTFQLFPEEACFIEVPQRNEADGLELGRVRAVRKRPGNHPPLFDPPRNLRILAGTRLEQTFTASDADGDPILFFAQTVGGLDVPAGSEIEDHRDGTATFRWTPRLEQVGTYAVRVAAFDEGAGEVYHDVTVSVCPRFAPGDDRASIIEAIFTGLPPGCTDADVNGDGAVSVADVVAAP